MKRIIFLLTVVLSLSCVNREEEQQSSIVHLSVSVQTDDTKTEIFGTAISFLDNDEQILVVCQETNKTILSNKNSGNHDCFNGYYKRVNKTKSDAQWYALYPSDLVTIDGVVEGRLSPSQTAPFDPNANIMYSDVITAEYNEDNQPPLSFRMNQMMGLIRINFINSDPAYADDILQTIQIRASSALTGDFQMQMDSPVVSFPGSSIKQVTSKYEHSEALGTGVSHWTCVFVNPATITAATLIIRTDKHTFTYKSTKSFSPSAGTLTLLPMLNLSAFSVDGPTGLKRRVALWGDSLTQGVNEYSKTLQELLGDDWEVINGGQSGDRTYEIAARQGGLPIVTGSAFTIPSGTNTITIDGIKRTHSVMKVEGFFDIRNFVGRQRNPCLLVGTKGEEVLCNISQQRVINGTDTVYNAKLTRLTAGEAVEIAEHTPILTYAARELRNVDLSVIYMGTNGSFGSDLEGPAMWTYSRFDNLIDQHWEMINFTIHPDSYLVLGIHWTPNWEKNYGYETLFETEFGSRFVNLRIPIVKDEASCKSWLLSTGAYADESDIPQSELDRAAQGLWPQALMTDNMHPSSSGAKCIAHLVYDRMVELGYVD